jgi:hypothetical protein
MKMAYRECPVCKKLIVEDSEFCIYCGMRLRRPEPVETNQDIDNENVDIYSRIKLDADSTLKETDESNLNDDRVISRTYFKPDEEKLYQLFQSNISKYLYKDEKLISAVPVEIKFSKMHHLTNIKDSLDQSQEVLEFIKKLEKYKKYNEKKQMKEEKIRRKLEKRGG